MFRERGELVLPLAHIASDVALIMNSRMDEIGSRTDHARGDRPMTDAMVTADNAPSRTGDQDRSKVLRRLKLRDTGFRILTQISAATVLLILCGVILSLVIGSLPAIREFGLGFLFTQRWNTVTEKFGALAPISGTLITAAIAMVIAIPVGLGISIFLTELCPQPLRRPIAIAIELLAGIPSIIYGIWGLFIFAPFVQD